MNEGSRLGNGVVFRVSTAVCFIKSFVHLCIDATENKIKTNQAELTVMDSVMLGSVEEPLQGTEISDQLQNRKRRNHCK